MSIHVWYMVRCSGGGWLVIGRPLGCHQISTKFATIADAHHMALRSGWTCDATRKVHTCPNHQEEERNNHEKEEHPAP